MILSTLGYYYEESFMAVSVPSSGSYLAALGYLYFAILGIGASLFGYGVVLALRQERVESEATRTVRLSPSWIFSYLLSQRRYRRLFFASTVLYAAFYSVVTSMIVWQPGVDFFEAYSAHLPSAVLTPCCGAPLLYPEVTVYVANHIGLIIIPLTLLLLLTVSVLVGVNFSLAAFAFDNRARGGGQSFLGGIGAAVGLFTGCPTCAGLFFANVFGGSGAVSLATALTFYQPVFILLAVPVLLLTPYLISRSLSKVFREGCILLPKAVQDGTLTVVTGQR